MDDNQIPKLGTIPEPFSSERRKRLWFIVPALFLVFVLTTLFNVPNNFPQNGETFFVTSGESLKDISIQLKNDGYINSRFLFIALVTVFGGERHVSGGDYLFSTNEKIFNIAWQIASGNHNILPIKITIPEGENVKEISGVLSSKIPNFQTDLFIEKAKPYEGYIFPQTYFFYPKTNIDEIIKEMRTMFNTQTSAFHVFDILGSRTKSDIVIMASLIEREAHGSDDRAIISGILWTRLTKAMPLQVDATIAYAKGGALGDTLTKKDISIDSPYNTYLHKGLPPTPISNPGLAAIKAAINPVQTPYLYYLHDKHGIIHYAKTYAEHQRNIAMFLK